MAAAAAPPRGGREFYEKAYGSAKSAPPHAASRRDRYEGRPFRFGDCVEVHGLASECGRPLNGRTGVVSGYSEASGRFDVRFGLDKEVALKPMNLRPPRFRQGDRVAVKGLVSEGVEQEGIVGEYVEETDRWKVCFEPERVVSLRQEHFRRPPMGAGDRVEVCGLASEKGQQLNGRAGFLTKYVEDTGRYEVRFVDAESPCEVISLKPENLVRPELRVGDGVEVFDLESESGRLLNGQRGVIARMAEDSGRFQIKFKVINVEPENLSKVQLELQEGDCATVSGLPPESGGRALNGQRGLVAKYIQETGMYLVQFGASKSMNLKSEHLTKVGPSPGDLVEVFGLTSDAGRQMNGQTGTVLRYVEDAGRFQVQLEQPSGKLASLRPENLRLHGEVDAAE